MQACVTSEYQPSPACGKEDRDASADCAFPAPGQLSQFLSRFSRQ